ncbi:hypothetical protein D3C73_1340590 [compost metagenome]
MLVDDLRKSVLDGLSSIDAMGLAEPMLQALIICPQPGLIGPPWALLAAPWQRPANDFRIPEGIIGERIPPGAMRQNQLYITSRRQQLPRLVMPF